MKSMAESTTVPSLDEQHVPKQLSTSSTSPLKTSFSSMFLIKIMSKRRTWAFLFVSVYSILLSLSWNFLKTVLCWYESTLLATPSSSSSGWPALYASVLLGVSFGILSMVAALAVVVPATLVTWITILVLMTFVGKPRSSLVMEGKKLTGEITGFVGRVLIKEGNIVAAICAVIGYFALVRKGRDDSN